MKPTTPANTTKPNHASDEFFARALEQVESASIRAWARTPHNAPIFRLMAVGALKKGTSVEIFAALIVANAIGL